jgi:hypothetical protein
VTIFDAICHLFHPDTGAQQHTIQHETAQQGNLILTDAEQIVPEIRAQQEHSHE